MLPGWRPVWVALPGLVMLCAPSFLQAAETRQVQESLRRKTHRLA